MIPAQLNNHISIALDFTLVCCGLLVGGAIYKWAREHKDKHQSSAIVISLAMVLFAFVVRIAYFQPGRLFAPAGEFQHAAYFEWRWVMLLFVSLFALFWTRRLFISLSGEWHPVAHWGVYVGFIFAGASFSALAWWL